MKSLILDLRTITQEVGDEWVDSPARLELENAVLDYAGKVIEVKITIKKDKKK